MGALPRLTADLILLHPPAVFPFRDRGDVYFPFLGTTGDVPITPLYELFPLGFKALERHLSARGRTVRIVNLATLLARFPRLELEDVARALDAKLVGIDLHWLIHAQGSLAVAGVLRRERPDLPLVFGGISSTYYARELISRAGVDLVMRGYDTLEPTERLLAAIDEGTDLAAVPNLLWKDRDGRVRDNGLTHLPDRLSSAVDWTRVPDAGGDPSLVTMREVTTTHTAGCAFRCGYCGGSGDAFRRLYGAARRAVAKPELDVAREVASLAREHRRDRYHLYAMGLETLGPSRTAGLIDAVRDAGLRSVNWECYRLPDDDTLRRMVTASERTLLTLSPDSHDPAVARAAGRGEYDSDELEAFLARAFDLGVGKVDVWYFVGMPQQDERSARQTVAYAARLLDRFGGKADPMICPLMPNLDPASTFFEDPEPYGYRVFHRTLEDHRRAATRASPIARINYETRWLSRAEIFSVGLGAIRDLLSEKARIGRFSPARIEAFNALLDDAIAFGREVDAADAIADPRARAAGLRALEGEVRRRNEAVLTGGVVDQTWPVARAIGGRWCDETGWSAEQLAPFAESAARPS